MMNNEATQVKTQEDYSKFISIVNEFLQEQMNEDFMEKNLLEAGVTSLQMMRISNALRKHGYKISFAKMISDPYVKHWWDNADINVKRKSVPPLETSNNSPKQFPLTDVQYAYWVGRKEGQVLGGNACHAYFEFDPDTVNLERLQVAWEELQMRHPMLRAKFNNNGTQEIMEKPYSAKLQIYDFRKSDDSEHDLLAVREKLSHRKLDIANGQVAELGISLLPEDKLRMHFDIDLLVADMQSLQIIFRDLAAIYNSEYRPAIPENWDFGIYLENEKNNKINDYRKAEKYWKSEIESLPLGPALTLRTQPETIVAPKFSRRKYLLEHKKWEKLKSLAAQYCTTPAMVLLTLYAAVLDRWSTNQSFLINMPLFDRNTEIENIDNVIADFTNVLLFHADCKENCTFYEQLQKVQNQFRESVDNSEYSGVQVVRELSKLHPGEKCIAPVVFSCNYGTPFVDDKFEKIFGSLNYMVSQTPQVWIDFQIFEINNGLNLSWDAVDELFPDGMLDQMFAAFVAMLNELVSVKDWNKYVELLPDLAQKRGIDNITEYYGNGQLLHSAFFVNAAKKKNQIAIIDENDGRNYTYEEVANKAKRVSSYLKEQGVVPGDLLAVSLPRGINQIISILGILAAGAGYIPINVNQPLSRRERIYSKSNIKFAITDTKLKKELEWPEMVTVLDVMEADAYEPLNTAENYSDSNTAYVIFTSGSTGEPKGVEIAHFAAVNTIETINKQYRVSADDKIIAVSSYDFDLSVYDIFGILSAGGTLILIKDSNSRDAEVWLDIVERHSVTLWNSVPTLLNMLLIVAEGKGKEIPSLRLAMLSGDWIGMDIPERLNHVAKNSHLLSMGGATEASIWSNYFDVELPVPEEWSSIPYGKPLKNQYYRVVDSKERDCPTWVPGELWIGGTGVAKGYIGDSEITDKSFVNWNENRWYKTGDLGRYWADGNIEFLGRKDFQVKIRGHRIELGEIEAAMNKYPGVKKSVAAAIGDVQGNKYLAGYIIPENGHPESLFDVNKVSDTDLMDKWDRLWADLKEGVAEVTEENNVQEYMTLANCLDEVSREYMYSLMRTLGIWVEPGTKYKLSALLMSAGIDLSYQELIQQWVNELVKIGRILAEEDYFVNCSSPKEMDRAAFVEKYPGWEHEIDDALKYLEQFKKYCHAIMTGNMDTPELLAKDDYISPDVYMATLPGAIECKRTIKNILSLQKKEGTAGRTVRIMELGARNLELTSELLDCMDGMEYEYVCTDASSYYLNHAKEKFKNNSRVHYEKLDINSAPNTQGLAMHYFDVVLAVSTLHRCRDIKASLKYAGEYLRAGGLLILLETTENTILQHVSTGILEKGFSTVTDERKGTGKPLLTKAQWSDAVLKSGFAKVNTVPNDQLDLPIYNQGVIVALAQPETYAFNSTKLKEYLEKMIPSYMIPTAFMEIDKFPLSANGKVDRKALPVPAGETRENAKDQFQEPETAVEKELAEIWETVLHTENISRNDNYFELGGDSLLATQLNAEINKKFNINLSLEKIFSNPIFAEQAISIASMLEDCEVKNMNAEKLEMVSPKPKEWGEPFPLTDVQQSYWLGRNGGFALGDVSTHCYFEMDCGGLDTDLAEEKWRRLISRHGMMRAVFLNDGQNQKILSNVPEYEIKVYDLASQEDTADEKLESIREEMAYQIFDTSKWPLFDVRFSKLPGGNVRLHISFDNIIFDGWSMFLILREWKMLYDNPEKEVEPLDLSFRDYVLAYEDIKKTEFYKRDEEYWQKRLPDIFPAPELPVIKENGNTAVQKFIRYESKLTGSQWSAIKNMASQNGLTASGVLMTAYAEVLGRWSKSQKFTINLTRFNRLPIHDQIMDVVGDFTSLTLLSIDNTTGKSFLERCKNLQQQLWSDLAHPYYSGVELEREISKKQEIRNAAIMPIVFTSGLGIKQGGSNEQEEYFGEMVYGLSQTPQVWIDHQVTEQNERLVLTWDAVQDIFPAGVLDEMFAAYISLLEVLSTEQEAWNRESNSLVQIPNMENRELANSVNGKIPDETLISLVEKSMKENPERIAIINNERKLSYGELERYSIGIGHILQRENVERNSLVAIVMEKGWEQIVAAISILKAGAAYLPIDPSFPEERVHLLLKNASVKVVLTQEKVNREVNWPEDTTIICVDGVDVESIDTTDFESIATGNDLAYVIYTSGSTGMPKGVMIEHRAAVNTIIDVNERFAVGKDDKCIALSNLNFDLSVYDIFGLLIAGGTVVIPDAKQVKEPQHWLEIMQENKITVWNSVPAFMQMFMEFLSAKPDTKLPLRVVIMSGDWIPMELPEMIKMHSESVRVISMGGATEASIWSNYYEVESVKDGWTSIPYGKPLTNQKFYVLDQEMNDCPNWVAGRLFIAGEGLARGYWKDRKRTEERFINHPVTHERLYYTGDLGRYWPDGNIEFLGREDTQVKVRGHRIELGEAENVLLTHELIKSAVVVVEEDKSGLAAAVVLNEDSDCCDNKNVEKILHEYLGKKLPEYMVPGKILVMEQLPLSVNGKVDRKALRKILGGYQGQISDEKKKEAPQGELEVKIAAIWERVLGTKEISRDDDFFMCGGDSLKAVKIISELNATEGLPNDLAIQTLFALPTVALLAEQIEKLVSLLDVEENTEYEEGVL